jgi:hypothetical protein
MKTKLAPILLCIALAIALCGCASAKLDPSIVRLGVSTSVQVATLKYPTAVPYLRAATPVICESATGTNISPTEVILAIEKSSANLVKTPEGVLILNGALVLYTGIWNSYGANTVANNATLRTFLGATCLGMQDGLGMAVETLKIAPAYPKWPTVPYR